MKQARRFAWLVMLIADAGLLAWGALAALAPGAIGPFELTEYLGLALIWGALALTAPFRAAGRPVPSPRL
jgi:hypothetical protein